MRNHTPDARTLFIVDRYTADGASLQTIHGAQKQQPCKTPHERLLIVYQCHAGINDGKSKFGGRPCLSDSNVITNEYLSETYEAKIDEEYRRHFCLVSVNVKSTRFSEKKLTCRERFERKMRNAQCCKKPAAVKKVAHSHRHPSKWLVASAMND